MIASGLSEVATVTLAKAEHRGTWVGELIRHSFSYPGITDPKLITFFDRDDRESLVRIIGELAQDMAQRGKSVMVHVEGTRGLSCRQPVIKMSSAFIDMAFAVGAPIVPVRFVGGLPQDELSQRLEFPLGYGRQDIWIGRPIEPAALASLPLKERKQVVIDAAINGLGPSPSDERPTARTPPSPAASSRGSLVAGPPPNTPCSWPPSTPSGPTAPRPPPASWQAPAKARSSPGRDPLASGSQASLDGSSGGGPTWKE